jgi:hypothetical protein
MAKQTQLRRGTTAEHGSFTGADGEVTFDTDRKVTRGHDGTTTGGFSGLLSDVVTLTSNTTLDNSYFSRTVLCDSSGGAFTITLPTHNAGFVVTFVLTDATNDVTIEDSGSTAVQTLDYAGETVTLVSDGANWQRVADGNGVVESGSNSNGEYVRFADGTQICWANVEGVSATAERASGVYGSGGGDEVNWTFPASFVSAPKPSFEQSSRTATGVLYGDLTTSGLDVGLFDINGSVSDATVLCMAVGSWK